jgi:hypothetical protein
MASVTSEERFFLALIVLIIMAVSLPGCAAKQIPVTVEKVVESKVPVSSPCVVNRPDAVTALRDKMTRQEWDSLTTDQREKLLGAQALDRKAYGDKLDVATAGCR